MRAHNQGNNIQQPPQEIHENDLDQLEKELKMLDKQKKSEEYNYK